MKRFLLGLSIVLTVLLLTACGSVDAAYDLDYSELKTYNVMENLIPESIKTKADGSVYFESTAPDGGIMRFEGKGITVTQGEIRLEPDGGFYALDAIGRICAMAPHVSDVGNEENCVEFSGGYTFTDAVKVDSADELFKVWGFVTHARLSPEKKPSPTSAMEFQPNFIGFNASEMNQDAFSISELTVYYDETTYNTGVRMMALDYEFYGTYLVGERYDSAKEVYDSDKMILDFYLMVLPELANEKEPFRPDPTTDEMVHRCIIDIDRNRYTIGDLKDADGNVLDKATGRVTQGSTLEVTLGDYTCDILLPVVEQYTGAQNLHQLLPFDTIVGSGEITSLVVPVVWKDQPEQATDEVLERLYQKLGRVEDKTGTVTDYSKELTDGFSLSEYYDIASYGKHKITSFVTDWYNAPYNFADDMEDMNVLGGDFMEKLYQWLLKTYRDMDWSRFDQNGDGFFDSVTIVNVGQDNDEEMNMGTYSYAQRVSMGYTGEGAGTRKKPVIKNHISMNASFLEDNTLIHEYAHELGLIDYYDVTYSGIDAVGHYDMQSQSTGDWNAYSKYAAGWIQPQVVPGLAKGESMEITIGSFANTGDAIVIPIAGESHDGPFGEYIMVDLFTPDGVNRYDAADYGLQDAVGVRMYHVDAVMEKRVLHGEDGVDYPIGTPKYVNASNKAGKYHLELLQAGGVNTFTGQEGENSILSAEDLFKAGDSFTAESFDGNFTHGRMDNGSEFGYTVQVVRIDKNAAGEYTAVIRVVG